MKQPETDPNTISILAPSLAEAQALAARLRQLPEVARVTTLQSFIPEDQDAKLAIIHHADRALKPALEPSHRRLPPSDAEDVEAMGRAAQILTRTAAYASGKGADEARHLALLTWRLAAAAPEMREAARTALLPSLATTLGLMRASLEAQKVTLASIPQNLARFRAIPDGAARIEVAPAGNSNDNAELVRFSEAVLTVAPKATGQPVIIQESGDTVVKAFAEAGIWALLSISLLLLIVLRRVSDVLLTLISLALAGVVTLEITVLTGMSLNFANIIALPLLLGVGVPSRSISSWRGAPARQICWKRASRGPWCTAP